MTLPLIELHGSPAEQGEVHGQALRSQIAHNLEVYFDRFLHEGGVARSEVLQRAERYAHAITRQNPDYAAGMVGCRGSLPPIGV